MLYVRTVLLCRCKLNPQLSVLREFFQNILSLKVTSKKFHPKSVDNIKMLTRTHFIAVFINSCCCCWNIWVQFLNFFVIQKNFKISRHIFLAQKHNKLKNWKSFWQTFDFDVYVLILLDMLPISICGYMNRRTELASCSSIQDKL